MCYASKDGVMPRILAQNSNVVELVKNLKKLKTSHSNYSGYIEDGIMSNHDQKQNWKILKT